MTRRRALYRGRHYSRRGHATHAPKEMIVETDVANSGIGSIYCP